MRYANYSFSLVLLLSSCSQLTLPIKGDRPVVPGVPSGGELQINPSNVHSKDPVGYTIGVLEAAFGPWIESTSLVAAVSCGLALGVATGPV